MDSTLLRLHAVCAATAHFLFVLPAVLQNSPSNWGLSNYNAIQQGDQATSYSGVEICGAYRLVCACVCAKVVACCLYRDGISLHIDAVEPVDDRIQSYHFMSQIKAFIVEKPTSTTSPGDLGRATDLLYL